MMLQTAAGSPDGVQGIVASAVAEVWLEWLNLHVALHLGTTTIANTLRSSIATSWASWLSFTSRHGQYAR